MPELLCVQTPEFELSIWSNDISKRQKAYIETLNKRVYSQAFFDENVVLEQRRPLVYFSPALQVKYS